MVILRCVIKPLEICILEIYSTAEVAKRLHIHHFAVNRLIRAGKLPATKIGRTWVVAAADLRRFEVGYVTRRGRPPKQPSHTKEQT